MDTMETQNLPDGWGVAHDGGREDPLIGGRGSAVM